MRIVYHIPVVLDAVPVETFKPVKGTNPRESLLIPNNARSNLTVEDTLDFLETENG